MTAHSYRFNSPAWLPQRNMKSFFVKNLWRGDQGQDIAEYAAMAAIILLLVLGVIRLIGSNANTVFSKVASTIQ
jgi:Flp pilus assembly pilin Flp